MDFSAASLLALIAFSGVSAQAGTVLKLNYGTVESARYETALTGQQGNSQAETRIDLIAQFKNSITEQDKTWLLNQGFEIFGYLPEDALVVRGLKSKLVHLQKNENRLQAVVNYFPQFKVSPSFGAMSVFTQNKYEQIVVQTFKANETEQIALQIEKMIPGVQIQNANGTSISLLAPIFSTLSIAGITGVEHVQPNPQMTMMMMSPETLGTSIEAQATPGDYSDVTGFETGTKVMNFESAWNLGLNGKGQVAAMADTGLDNGDIATLSQDFKTAVTTGYHFGAFAKTWADPMGHGTHVSGSIAGRGAFSKGLFKGGAFEAQFIPNGMWSPMLNNLSIPNNIQDLFKKSYADGARIHSNSWGSPRAFGVYDNFASKVDEFVFNNPDMLILFAAGNSGVDKDKDGRIDPNSIGSPGTSKNILSVGASENVLDKGGIQVPISKLRSTAESWPAEPIFSSRLSDNANGLAMFSSRGPTTDGRIKPDLVAPGTNILSARSHEKGAEDLWGKYNDDYVYSGGTSMSTPLVAGAATLTRQFLIEKKGISQPSAALIKATMLHKAVDMFPGQYGEVGVQRGQELATLRPNSDEGYGRVDVAQIVQASTATQFVDNKDGLAQGESKTYSVQVKNGKLLANLVWTDAPGSPNASSALVNDLDLVVKKADGSTSSMNDRINNTEIVELKNVVNGKYEITVKATKVPSGKNGKQPFALVFAAE